MREGIMKVTFNFLNDNLDEFTRFEVVRDGKEVSKEMVYHFSCFDSNEVEAHTTL
jgi:hypothetical protein